MSCQTASKTYAHEMKPENYRSGNTKMPITSLLEGTIFTAMCLSLSVKEHWENMNPKEEASLTIFRFLDSLYEETEVLKSCLKLYKEKEGSL